jgi:hypothetical protein
MIDVSAEYGDTVYLILSIIIGIACIRVALERLQLWRRRL